MKALISGGSLALALLLAGCGEGGDAGNGTATSTANNQPLKQVEAPNGDWTQTVATTAEGGFVMGNPNAPVKLVEYASLTCPHCATFSGQATERLKNEYVKSGQVSYEFRNFVLNPIDLAATMLVRCQGTAPFFRLTEQLFEQQQQWTAGFSDIPPAEQQRVQGLPREQQVAAMAKAGGLDQFFRQRGMPEQRINACLGDQQELQAIVQRNEAAINQYKVEVTPTFFINGEKLDGGTWADVEPQLREAIG